MSLNIYGSEIPDSSSGSEDDEVDGDFADYLETSILSQKEEEATTISTTTSSSSSPMERQESKADLLHYLPEELKFQIITGYLTPALHKQICKKYLVKLQEPQRCKILSRLAYKLSDCSVRARPKRTSLPSSCPTISLEVVSLSPHYRSLSL
ncbi:hypothetical protein TrRE_jg6233 [Triparma retinervis]|uniref:Uncharacterized protein n=1 Tax=Triparma retinervis TaxID=2557542 RepID=A0A9W7AMF0_9STRA|nr:hypothetical protein TrRE_jg6233 [Triparma retinervis]